MLTRLLPAGAPIRTVISSIASRTFPHQIVKLRKPILFMYLCGLMSACSSTQITPTTGQNVIYANGQATVCSVTKTSFVAIQPLGKDNDGRLVFRAAVNNGGRAPFNFGLENIRVTDGTGKPLHLFSRAEVERHARVRATWLAVAAGMNTASQSFAAAQPVQTYYTGNLATNSAYSVRNVNGEPIGSLNGYSNGTFQGSSTTYNPAGNARSTGDSSQHCYTNAEHSRAPFL